MKIVFMGTPDFSAGILKALSDAGHRIVLVVTQPDKPKGRGGKVSISPVKECALSHGFELFQPEKIKNEEGIKKLSSCGADIFVVAAFGQILSKEILDIPEYGCVNVHASLLPQYRGASPIQQAILDGRTVTGVTIMQMDEGVDTGDILMKKEVPIDEKETGGSLFDKLSDAGSKLIVEALEALEEGKIIPEKQDESLSSHVKQIKKQMGRIDFSKDAAELERMIRAFDPWPGAYTFFNSKSIRFWSADVEEYNGGAKPGQIYDVTKDAVCISCGRNALKITELQMEGKKRMGTKDFLLGFTFNRGDVFGQ